MKKSLIVCVLLCGCAGFVEPVKTIRNDECVSGVFEIQQVLDNGFLITACQYLPYTGIWNCTGPDAFYKTDTKKEPWNSFAEGMQISTPMADTCLKRKGTYKYVTRIGTERTVMNLVGDSLYVPNPEYEVWQKEQEKLNEQAKEK